MTQPKPRLLLVYNADSGLLNAIKDTIWKAVSPSTYPCSLCAITYGAVSMHDDWRRFLKSLQLEIVFHHKDDFAAAYPGHGFALPTILVDDRSGALQVLLSNEALDRIPDTTALIERVEERLVDEHLRRPFLRVVA